MSAKNVIDFMRGPAARKDLLDSLKVMSKFTTRNTSWMSAKVVVGSLL